MREGNKSKRGCLKWALLVLVIAILAGGYQVILARPAFDPVEVGQAETKMWQAYYAKDQKRLAYYLVQLIRKQYGLSMVEAAQVGERFARSAMEFKSTRRDYEAAVLPGLTEAYGVAKRASGASFDPEQAARAELAWWVARRTKGQNSPENVGRKITELYTLLYGSNQPSFAEAGLLRAQAAALRDSERSDPDWTRIEEMLIESYEALGRGI